MKKLSALGLSGLAMLGPLAASLAVFLDPLRRRRPGRTGFVRVAGLPAVPEDGQPRRFPVVTSRIDVWSRLPEVPVGAVYLRRTGPQTVQAFNVVCPHAGCFVEYDSDRRGYLCPCHNSTFALDGQVRDPGSPSPRGLDELEVEVREGTEIWVKFQNFQAGKAAKIPIA